MRAYIKSLENKPLSAPQPEFTFEYDGRTYTISNALLVHKLLATGQGEQVVSRKGELNQDLLASTCSISRGSEPQDHIPNQVNALHLAAMFNSSSHDVEALIEAGSDVNSLESDQMSPLHYASYGNPNVVPVLLQAGANVNQLDKWDRTPLLLASLKNTVVSMLLDAGATVVELRLRGQGTDTVELSDNGHGVQEANFAGNQDFFIF